MRKYNDDKYKTASILGSFNRHYEIICNTANYFEQNGIKVLAPKITTIKQNVDGYAILNTDTSTEAVILEKDFLDNCMKSDFVYVCNKEGYLGKTVMLELGFMLGKGQEVFFMESPVEEKLILEMTQKAPIIFSPEDLVKMIKVHNDFQWVDFSGNDLCDRLDNREADFRFPSNDGDER